MTPAAFFSTLLNVKGEVSHEKNTVVVIPGIRNAGVLFGE
jgi:hypothetical protein